MNVKLQMLNRAGRSFCTGAIAVMMLIGASTAFAAAPDGSTGRALTAALIGRSSLREADLKKVEAAVNSALTNEKIAELARCFGEARAKYLQDRKKFPAERSDEVSRNYRQSLKETVGAVRAAITAKDPEVAKILDRAGSEKGVKTTGAAKEYEGENATDSAARNRLAVQPIEDVPGLPRVLLIGDSISIGYTLQVRALLKGKANVHRIPVNGGATEVGLLHMKEWLGNGKWDVIHFNFGLHDAKFASETTQRASREEYAKNLQQLVAQMQKTGATLVFATTTPVPNNGYLTPTRRFDSIPARNDVAKKVMEENGVSIDDLYSVVLPVQSTVGRTNDVHFQPEGYDLLAKAVAASIEAQLKKPLSSH